ncbi:glycosyltransferase [Saccharothrix australiensis]|uniref:Glycosyltransferase involved in cell wall biosynthesis n=1 Tax=Saccharothrix australiensis TaxID=2072 RepID=A0A495WDD0_9PSEU|nr:glycosyltransferase [Saccharothrix australiensis]RKT57778.1 glycosyltransferase involved in cell wall biosynthesis [Saccharothrix australiensis]
MPGRFASRTSGQSWNRPPKAAVLYLTNQSSYPPHSGGQVREWQFLSRLDGLYEVHFVAVTPHFDRDVETFDALLRHCRTVTFFEADPAEGDPAVLPDRVRRHCRADVNPYLRSFIAANGISFVHVEGFFLMPHVPEDCGVPVHLVEENIEYQLEKSRQEVLGGDGPHWTVTRDLEHAAWRRAAKCGVVSLDDEAVMRADMPDLSVSWLPMGCDHFRASDDPGEFGRTTVDGPLVVYTGSAAWSPSRDATLWLLDHIWPRVRARVPAATLAVAGSGQTREALGLTEVDPSVRLLGTLPSFGPLLGAADVFLCPLRFGGGTKAKILEGLAAGCAVVSTPAGVQGIDPEVREAVLVRDSAEELADAVTHLLVDGASAEQLRKHLDSVRHLLPTWDDALSHLDKAWSETAGK